VKVKTATKSYSFLLIEYTFQKYRRYKIDKAAIYA